MGPGFILGLVQTEQPPSQSCARVGARAIRRHSSDTSKLSYIYDRGPSDIPRKVWQRPPPPLAPLWLSCGGAAGGAGGGVPCEHHGGDAAGGAGAGGGVPCSHPRGGCARPRASPRDVWRDGWRAAGPSGAGGVPC